MYNVENWWVGVEAVPVFSIVEHLKIRMVKLEINFQHFAVLDLEGKVIITPPANS